MKAGILTIGDELLIGQVVNTNLAWIGNSLTSIGIKVVSSTTIQDEKKAIVDSLDKIIPTVDLLIITGGLGPTNDDITKATLTEYFDSELVLHPKILHKIEKLFTQKGKNLLPSNKQQAMLPKDAIILDNALGTASGMWFTKKNTNIISLPGVPYEMKHIMEFEVLPRLQQQFQTSSIYHQTLMLQGIAESTLAEKIKNWENKLRLDELKLAYLPSPGLIKLRVTSLKGKKDATKIEDYLQELEKEYLQYIYGRNGENIFYIVGEILKSKHATLGTIESCTGGLLAHQFIQNDGASDYFQGSLLTYSNVLKSKLAHVNEETILQHGAVSEETVKAMAEGGRKVLHVDYTIAVSGIAGPTGGSPEKPVGTIWIAIATPGKTYTKLLHLNHNRNRNMEITTLYAANILRKILLQIPFED